MTKNKITLSVIGTFTTQSGSVTALIERQSNSERICQPFVVVYGFDQIQKIWRCGEYFSDKNEAVNKFLQLFREELDESEGE